MSNNIALVCDSVANIPKFLLDKYNIDVVSLTTKINGVEYRDTDIECDEFYELMKSSEELPKTSQATYIDFMEVFNKHVSDGKTVLYISASSKATGTYQSAMLAKNDINGVIHIIDSLCLSLGCGMLVLEAAKMIENGLDIEEVICNIEDLRSKLQLLIIPNSLEYLYKGGRLSSGKALIGSVLNIKPILTMKDGFIVPQAQVRGNKKVISTIIKTIIDGCGEDLDFSDKVIGLGYGDNIEELAKLKELVIKELNPKEIIITQINSSISSHVGPSTLGITWFK